MDTTQKFTGLARSYVIGRPSYADALINDLYTHHGLSARSVIADIGCGTGKFTRQLLDMGSTVFGVEPNDEMRAAAVKDLHAYPTFRAICGTAAQTSLESRSVDYITAAQAFHWFDVPLFQKECRRILKGNGMVFLVWNMRDLSSEVNRYSAEIYSKYCPSFKGFGGGIQKDDPRIGQFFGGKYTCAEYDHPLFYDEATFIRRSLSGSYSLKDGDPQFPAYQGALTELFRQYAKDQILTMENKTVVYFGRII